MDREQLAREAIEEVTLPGEVGALLDEVAEGDGVVTLHFAATDPAYPGWRWTVSVAQLEGEEPTVLESELIPGDGALLAPEWIPWSERLEEWRVQQAAEAAARGEDDEHPEESPDADASDEDEDEDDSDEDDDDSDEDDDDSDEDDSDEDDDDSDEDDSDDDDDSDEDDDDLGDDVYDGLDPEAAAGLDDDDEDR